MILMVREPHSHGLNTFDIIGFDGAAGLWNPPPPHTPFIYAFSMKRLKTIPIYIFTV
jgi:hypothetical protein